MIAVLALTSSLDPLKIRWFGYGFLYGMVGMGFGVA
jgi:hypothetical protein